MHRLFSIHIRKRKHHNNKMMIMRSLYSNVLVYMCLFQAASCYRPAVSTQDNTRDIGKDVYVKAAVESGMDPVAVAEVVRTGKPVVKVQNSENGAKQTTTYSMQPDGTITRHTQTEYTSPTKTFEYRSPTMFNYVPPPPTNSDWNEWSTNEPRKWFTNWQTAPFDDIENQKNPQNSIDNRQNPINGVDNNDSSRSVTTKTFTNGDSTKKVTTIHTVDRPTIWKTNVLTYPSTAQVLPQSSSKDWEETSNKQLPSLDDFLRSQYDTTATKSSHSKPVTTININDLPITEVLNGRPIIHNHQVKSPQPADMSSYSRTIQKSFESNGPPNASNIDSSMREMLDKAGIDPTEAFASPDGTVTRTRTRPDGSKITTTFRVRAQPIKPTLNSNEPNIFGNERPQGPFFIRETPQIAPKNDVQLVTPNQKPKSFSHIDDVGTKTFSQSKPAKRFDSILPNSQSQKTGNPIDEFLEKLGLTSDMLAKSNGGDYVKTIVDDDGRVLTANFILSKVRNDNKYTEDGKAENKPLKR